MKHETLFDRTRGIKGNRHTVMAFCRHGRNTIKDGKPYERCGLCEPVERKSPFVPNMTPFFNHGLGCVTHGTRDAERQAKKRGLQPVGDATPREIFKSTYPDHPMTKGM